MNYRLYRQPDKHRSPKSSSEGACVRRQSNGSARTNTLLFLPVLLWGLRGSFHSARYQKECRRWDQDLLQPGILLALADNQCSAIWDGCMGSSGVESHLARCLIE